MLSAIIAALAAMKKIRKSRLANEVNARCLETAELEALILEFNCLERPGHDPMADCSGIRAGDGMPSVHPVRSALGNTSQVQLLMGMLKSMAGPKGMGRDRRASKNSRRGARQAFAAPVGGNEKSRRAYASQ